VVKLEDVANLLEVVHLSSALDQSLDRLIGCADSSWNLVNILRLDNGLQVILEELGKVVYALISLKTLPGVLRITHSEAQNRGSI